MASPNLHNSWLPVAWAAGTTVLTALVLQSLLLAVALGTSDYSSGTPGLGLGPLRFWSAAGLGLATLAGAAVARHRLRWVGLAPGANTVLTLAGPTAATVLIAALGLVRHADPFSVVVMVCGGASGLAAAVLLDRYGPGRDHSR